MKTIKAIAQLGGRWYSWSSAGAFYWYLDNSVGNRNRNIRGHLIIAKYSRVKTSGYFYNTVWFFQPCHLAKQKNRRCRQVRNDNTALLNY
nr:MAG TPA: hypothetical protein [Caudoviricetes sp.]